ncbi:MAG TPA: hypothetical protein HPP83_10720, partial [Candidatus Hydrogenedentes bacterium]|nr:hypothetical protein [Candidatus Hydrogenedentota bacterium]
MLHQITISGSQSLAFWPILIAMINAHPEVTGRSEGGEKAVIRVGITEGDICATDNRALQAAMDYVAGLGGGTVQIAPGTYPMRNALTLRDHVRVVGVPGETVLAICDTAQSPLAKDGDCNQREISLADPAGFRVGDGVAVSDTRYGGGFCVTTATLTGLRDANVFAISRPLYLDYCVSKCATARLVFPGVRGDQITHAAIEGLTIEGNRENSSWLDGCRGGGIYLFECNDVVIRNCVVRGYNGDGVSFQVSSDVIVEDCRVEGNAGCGLHPGSGSQRPIVRHNHSVGNDGEGMFVCWRVQHGLFEANE